MKISRRAFLDICKGSAIGLGALKLAQLDNVMANPNAPTVVWLQGASCTGCSVSFLNRIASAAPKTAADVLIQTIDLEYHPTLMATAGQSAVDALLAVQNAGNYVLAVEGGVPTAFGGAACWAYSNNGTDVTFLSAVQSLASRALAILSIGTCAAYGGIPATGGNPAGIKSVSAATGKPTVNIPGCPSHPDWVVWAIANFLTNSIGSLDSKGRPTALFGKTCHDLCPRKPPSEQHTRCTEPWGCQGKYTYAPCPVSGWNNGVSWCIDVNSICIGCTEPTFATSAMRLERASINCYGTCHHDD